MEKLERPDLLQFLMPVDRSMKILVIESLPYLPRIRALFPQASLYAVTGESERQGDYPSLDITWEILDYRETPLPFPQGVFDLMLGDNLLGLVSNPQDIASGLGTFLKPTGRLLTSFENIRCWRILESLMEGHYRALARRLYARRDFATLLYASFYKEIFFLPVPMPGNAPLGLIERLVQAGFENPDDMKTEFWLVDAWRSSREVSFLKSRYNPVLRRRLVKLLHRIEYGINVAENVAELWCLMERENVDAGYLSAFILSTVVHSERFFENLRKHSEEEQCRTIEKYVL